MMHSLCTGSDGGGLCVVGCIQSLLAEVPDEGKEDGEYKEDGRVKVMSHRKVLLFL